MTIIEQLYLRQNQESGLTSEQFDHNLTMISEAIDKIALENKELKEKLSKLELLTQSIVDTKTEHSAATAAPANAGADADSHQGLMPVFAESELPECSQDRLALCHLGGTKKLIRYDSDVKRWLLLDGSNIAAE